ncbi:hypothetical protein ACR42D_17670 [Desulfovibrio caledoniensis]
MEKQNILITVILIGLLCSGRATAGCRPERYVGPEPGCVYEYEHYAGGPTKVFGVDRTAEGGLKVLVETTLPPGALPQSGETGVPERKSRFVRTYTIQGSRVVLRSAPEDFVLLDLSGDEWTFQARVYAAVADGQGITQDSEEPYNIVGRIAQRKVVALQGKEREAIQVGYFYVDRNNRRRPLAVIWFVEGLGRIYGELSDPIRCRRATPGEMKAARRIFDADK